MFTAALHSGEVWLAVIGLVNSGVAAYYYLRLLTSIYAKPTEDSPVLAVPRLQTSLSIALLLTVSTTLILLASFPGTVLGSPEPGPQPSPELNEPGVCHSTNSVKNVTGAHVRTSVHGPKKLGEVPSNALIAERTCSSEELLEIR